MGISECSDFWLIAFGGARGTLGLVGEEGSEQERPQPPQNWSPVNKNLFPSIHIFGSCELRVTGIRTPCCTVTLTHITQRLPFLQDAEIFFNPPQ